MRTNIASVQYNTKGHSGSSIQEFIFGKSTPICKKMENVRKRKCLKNAAAEARKPKNYPSEEPPKKKKKRQYGDGHEDIDMNEAEFAAARVRFYERITENQSNRSSIEIETRAQHHSFKWAEVRRLLLTSSYFGRILNARSRNSYPNIVTNILYQNAEYSNTADMRHQRIYETEAISAFTDLYPHDSIKTCGIFIDRKIPFLGKIFLLLIFFPHFNDILTLQLMLLSQEQHR